MRECGSCTKCCEGWLTGTANGYAFWPGRKCHFMNSSGCTIYKDRPEDPCRTYSCAWLKDETIPEWMKPSESDVILTWRLQESTGVRHLEVLEAGAPLTAQVLSWAILYALNNNYNIRYQVNGGWNKIGSNDFLES